MDGYDKLTFIDKIRFKLRVRKQEKIEDKRQSIEHDDRMSIDTQKIINELLPVLDSMERAIDACTDKEDDMYKGIELVHKQLIGCLQKFGVEEIQALDEEFNPHLHLAVMQENVEDVEPNKVIMVMQKGYKLKTKVLRPAMVKVSC